MTHTDPLLRLGTRLFLSPGPAVLYDSQELRLHQNKPWLRHYVREYHHIELKPPAAPKPFLHVRLSLLGRHAVIVGASGYGKTHAAMHLVREQLKAGCSLFMLDVKEESIRQALHVAQEAGVPTEDICVLWPSEAGRGVPGWNPFAVDPSETRQAVRQFVALLKAGTGNSGSRMWDVLHNAATVIAGQGLSLLELMRFLQSAVSEDGAYWRAVVNQARTSPAWAQFPEPHRYFDTEFPALSKADRAGYVQPLIYRLRPLLDIPYLNALLCAREDTLDMASLWQRQRVVLVHLDSFALGEDGLSLLSGLLAHSLFSVATRRSGPVPVCLLLDEAAAQEAYMGDAILKTLRRARSANLRVLAACQHLGQLSAELRDELLTSTALRLFLHLGEGDAPGVARSLATGRGGEVTKVCLSASGETARFTHWLRDDQGRLLQTTDEQLMQLNAAPDKARALRIFAVSSGLSRIDAQSPEGQWVEFSGYVSGLPERCWRFVGPAPLRLTVEYPLPKVQVLEQISAAERTAQLTKELQELPLQEALVRTSKGFVGRVRVADMSFPQQLPEIRGFLNGQSADELREVAQWREVGVDALSGLTQRTTLPRKAAKTPASGPVPVREEQARDDDDSL